MHRLQLSINARARAPVSVGIILTGIRQTAYKRKLGAGSLSSGSAPSYGYLCGGTNLFLQILLRVKVVYGL